jgi:sulfate/thiosulfate transport system ATP-binding protein
MSGIVVDDLNKSFGSFKAVSNVSFEAEEGKITAILGPSGSGKSTVLRMIAGLEQADSGSVALAGEEQTHASVQDRKVGFVFQHYALFRHMTVRQNVSFGLRVRKEPKDDVVKRVDELLELVQLGPWSTRYPDQLSGGQRQRVALARALAPRPKVLLLDEPFGALDARVRQDLRRWLDDLHSELGVTSLLVTHDQEEALELANEVVVMHQGRVEQVGTSDDVYNRPATPFVAGFVGAANVLRGRIHDGRVLIGDGWASWEPNGHALTNGTTVHAYVRPHEVGIGPEPGRNGASTASVERLTNLGWASKIRLRLSDGQDLTAEVPNEELPPVDGGSRVYLDLRNAKVFEAEDRPGHYAGVGGPGSGESGGEAARSPAMSATG